MEKDGELLDGEIVLRYTCPQAGEEVEAHIRHDILWIDVDANKRTCCIWVECPECGLWHKIQHEASAFINTK